MSDFLLDLRRSIAHKNFTPDLNKIGLDISTGMPAVFANPCASRSQHISSQKIAQLGYKRIIVNLNGQVKGKKTAILIMGIDQGVGWVERSETQQI